MNVDESGSPGCYISKCKDGKVNIVTIDDYLLMNCFRLDASSEENDIEKIHEVDLEEDLL